MDLQPAVSLLLAASCLAPAPLAALDAPARERHACCDTYHDFVTSPDGLRLRTIVTRPRNRPGRLPGILFTAWLSCDSVELRAGAEDGWSRFQRALVSETGAVVLRMDKPGVGDSEGACSATGFNAEVAAYRAAFDALKRLDFVDPDALAVVGGSMGGAIAPLVAQGEKVRAVAVWGTFSKTWLEHMLELERRRLALAGDSPATVNEKMLRYGELHSLFLTQRLLPREVLEKRPRLRPLWYDSPDGLYGRSAAFHHEAQETNVLAAWEKVEAPVLAVHGEYDWIMSRSDHEGIVEAVNRLRPGSARFVSVPRTDHNFMTFESPAAAWAGRGGQGGRYDGVAADAVVSFVRRQLGLEAQAQKAVSESRHAGNERLFDGLVGAWDVDVVTYGPGDSRTTASGDWRFERILGGRAIQDVWRVVRPGGELAGYGTTVRFYDAAIDAWRVTWHGVLSGTVGRFVARRQGFEIVMDAEGDGELSRWIFSSLTASSFRWRAVVSPDGGRTWVTQQEMSARRRRAPSAS